MNLEHVSVESSHVPHPRHPAQVNQSTTFSPQDTEASCQLQTKKSNIDQILTKLSDKGLSAKEHAKAYLHDMYRRNCRPNTIRTNSGSIILFLAFLKHLGKARLETVIATWVNRQFPGRDFHPLETQHYGLRTHPKGQLM
jgi:hypothetical protein